MEFFENNKYLYKLVTIYKNLNQNILVKKHPSLGFVTKKKKKKNRIKNT